MDEGRFPGEQPGRGHETSDANIRGLVLSGIGLLILILAGLLVSLGVFRYFVSHQGLGPPASPFANERALPPEPRLQVSAPADLKQYKAAQDEVLTSYGWVDESAGVVRIPIDRAMAVLLQKGLPVHSVAPAKQGAPKTSGANFGRGAGKAPVDQAATGSGSR